MQTIMLPRGMNIKRANQLYQAVLKVLEKNSGCAIDFSHVDRIDLSVGQLILGLGKEINRRGATLNIRNINDAVAHQLRLAGVVLEGTQAREGAHSF